MQRAERRIETSQGTLRVKRASGSGVFREKAEYEDLAAIARKTGMSLREVRALARREDPEGEEKK